MAGNLPRVAKPILCEELTCVANNDYKTFRITGRLESHDFTYCKATLVDPQSGAVVNINTQLIEPFEAKIGSLFQVLGECSFEGTIPTLKAYVIRCVDGMDLVLYKKTLLTQREYFQTRTASNSS